MASNVLEARINIPKIGKVLIAEEDLSCSVPLCFEIIKKGEKYISIHSNGRYHLHSPDCSKRSCYEFQVEE